MANAGAAANDGDALLYNPGLLTAARGVAVSVQRYGSASTAGSYGSVQVFGAWSIGVGAQLLDYRAATDAYTTVMESGATTLSDGGTVSAASSAFTLGGARTIKGLRVGANVKYTEERLGADRDGTAAFDLGVVRPWGQAIVSLAVQNLGAGPRIGGAEGTLPTRVVIGYGGGPYSRWEHWDLGMQTQLSVERDGFVRPAGGVELGYVPIEGVAIMLRHGFRLPREKDESLVTAGLGLNLDRWSIDYAMEPMRGGRPVSHRIGLRVR